MSYEFQRHADTFVRYQGRLEEFPDFQFELDGGVRGRTLPLRWDGTLEDLPRGIDGAFERAFGGAGGNVLCAVNVTVPPELRGSGLSRKALEHMRDVARDHGLDCLIAPVMPTWKERYPLAPIERYMHWRRDDGLLFDPWLRTHERLAARILKAEPHSIWTTGTVAEWEQWTAMAFPESGEYVIPGGQSTLAIDRERDVGRYAEPNVWMIHDV